MHMVFPGVLVLQRYRVFRFKNQINLFIGKTGVLYFVAFGKRTPACRAFRDKIYLQPIEEWW